MMVTVLFCAKDSIYKTLTDTDCWDEDRNAMLYTGTNPVVAHPPCNLWGKMAAVNFSRYGGDHNKPGNDCGMFRFALDAVNRCGGVLEHPAYSKAWTLHGLIKPIPGGWIPSGQGWVCQVSQSAYGHKARKKTWLYMVGNPIELDWSSPEGTHQIGHDSKRQGRQKPVLWNKHASATPLKFAELLLIMARRGILSEMVRNRNRSETEHGMLSEVGPLPIPTAGEKGPLLLPRAHPFACKPPPTPSPLSKTKPSLEFLGGFFLTYLSAIIYLLACSDLVAGHPGLKNGHPR